MLVGLPPQVRFASRTLLVDPEKGSDSTGARAREDKPFATLAGARDAVSPGDMIRARPWNYPEEDLCKGGWHAQLTGNAVRSSNVVTLTVEDEHPFAAGDTIFVTGVGVPTSGMPFDGIWTLGATTPTTLSYLHPGEDESAAVGSFAFAVAPLYYHFEGQSVLGHTSGAQRSKSIFGDVEGSTPTWTVVTGNALLAHTYAPIRITAAGSRMDLQCFGVRGLRDHNTTNEAITAGNIANSGVTFNATIFGDIYSSRYDGLILQGVRDSSIKCRRIISGDFEDNGAGYSTFGEGANAIEITGNNTDFHVECDEVRSIDAAISLGSGTSTRGYIKAKRIASTRTVTTNVTPAISADLGYYHGSTLIHNIVIEADEISSASTNAIAPCAGLEIKNARVVATRNHATHGAAIAFRGNQPDIESPVALTTGTPYLTLNNCTLVSAPLANYSIQSTSATNNLGAYSDNTVRIHGTVNANKPVQTPSAGVEGVNQLVGTVAVSSDVT